MRASAENILIISERDYQSLLPLAENLRTSVAEALDTELGRADIVPNKKLPKDVVTMNSVVTFLDMNTNEENTVSLVYPGEASVDLMKISVLSPVGCALIGLRMGGEINWPLPNGSRRLLRVVNVVQPENNIVITG